MKQLSSWGIGRSEAVELGFIQAHVLPEMKHRVHLGGWSPMTGPFLMKPESLKLGSQGREGKKWLRYLFTPMG